jgi:FKBP-type peptidyl-prolyl cis-trans isomerase
MNIFNKFELVGIFISVAVMALSLAFIRFKSDTFVATVVPQGETQSAVVAVSDGPTEAEKDANLRNALLDAASSDGTIVKLVKDDISEGTGDIVEKGDTVTVHYTGALRDGTKFDSSYDRGEPFTFTVGAGKVIAGWEEGLLGMKVGGERVLVIPGDMAYGNRKVGPIPANSTLIFTIKLLEVTK